MSEQELKNTIRAFYAYKLFSGGLAVCIPVIVLFWQRYGLTHTNIAVLQSFFAISLVLFEIPTGYLADRCGRKRCIALGAALIFCGSAVYWIADRLLLFGLAELIFAYGLALISGADAALLYDALKRRGRESEFGRLWGSLTCTMLIGVALATSSGGLLYAIDARLPFYVSSIPLALSAAAVVFMREDRRGGGVGSSGLAGVARTIRTAIVDNREYRSCLIEFATVTAILQCGLWYYQPFFQRCGVREVWFGFIFTSFNIVAAVGSRLSPKLEKSRRIGDPVVTQLVVAGIGYALMSVTSWTWGFVFIFLHQAVRGWLGVSMRERVNAVVDSRERATLLSVCSMSGGILYAALLPVTGMIADRASPVAATGVCTVLCACAAGCFSLRSLRRSSSEDPAAEVSEA